MGSAASADTWEGHALVAAAMLLGAAAATALTRAAALRLKWLAQPNARSSHAKPTPTAGGLGFVAPLVVYLAFSASDSPSAAVLATVGIVLAVLGLIDDVRDLQRTLRLATHIAAAAGCVLLLTETNALAAVVLILGLAWWINLYNFMDGIDGIAASQCVIFAAGALAIGQLQQSESLAWALLGASAGFLLFNWAPAKIFMGDAGSGFLGIVTGAFALILWQNGELPFVASLILLVGFWFDASYTLGFRIATGQPFADAHRSHLYQILSRRLGHGRTTALFCGHAALWLAPLAAMAVHYPAWQPAWLAAACVPIAIACIVFKAGAAHAG